MKIISNTLNGNSIGSVKILTYLFNTIYFYARQLFCEIADYYFRKIRLDSCKRTKHTYQGLYSEQ